MEKKYPARMTALIRYGSMVELTAGGSWRASENSQGASSKRPTGGWR